MSAPVHQPITAATRITAENAADIVPVNEAELLICLASWEWRIFSGQLYHIVVKSDDDPNDPGLKKPFLPKRAQRDFLKRVHHRNVILKARQLGMTTLVCILWLDHALWNPNQKCGIVAQDKDKAQDFLRDKILYAYDNLPLFLRDRFPIKTRNQQTVEFEHNSSIVEVKTSLRGGTYHRVHVSELGKIAATRPDKAIEVQTGTLPACPQDGIAIIESTAEGRSGYFYEVSTRAKERFESGRPLGIADYQFHFFPWWDDPGYQTDPLHVIVTPDDHVYFDEVEARTGTLLTNRQRAWYVAKREGEFAGNHELMWREYPSYAEEAFAQSVAGTYYATQLSSARLQRRITDVPHVEGVPVHTFWDIGAGDGTGVWCMQRVGLFYRLIAYVEGWDHGYAHYVKALKDKGWIFGKHYLPHDARHKRQMGNTIASPIEILEGIAPDWTFEIVPRVGNIQDGIQLVRQRFPEFYFDQTECANGLAHLAQYRKVWNTRQATWGDQPEKKDGHSEAADALRQLAQALANGESFDGARQSRQRRTRVSGMAA